MIQKVNINYNFGSKNIERELDFKEGINIVEQKNGWGKTLLTNTIMSLYTGYFGRIKATPDGFASIESDGKTFNLVKGTWIGSTNTDQLARYAIVGSFFNDTKSTVEQRKIITDLLDIDRDAFIDNYIRNYLDSIDEEERKYYSIVLEGEEYLKKKISESKQNESIILNDITRLKGNVLSFKKQEFKDIEDYNIKLEQAETGMKEYNSNLYNLNKNNIEYNSKIDKEKSSDTNRIFQIKSSLISKQKQLEELRIQYTQNSSSKCFNCGNDMNVSKLTLDSLKTKGEGIKFEIETLNKELEVLESRKYSDYKLIESPLPDVVSYLLINNLKLPVISNERLNEFNEYNKSLSEIEYIKKELSIKEKQLADLNTIQYEDCIGIINDAIEIFNKDLEKKLSSTGLKIQLFEKLKNGNIKQTFNIYHDDGTEYDDCSSGNKMMIQVKLALLFSKKFNMDFILIDNSEAIDNINIETISNYLKDNSIKQIILFKVK